MRSQRGSSNKDESGTSRIRGKDSSSSQLKDRKKKKDSENQVIQVTETD